MKNVKFIEINAMDVLRMGGAAAFINSSAAMQNRAEYAQTATKEEKEIWKDLLNLTVDEEWVVMYHPLLKKILTEEEMNGIFAHEVAHLTCDHLVGLTGAIMDDMDKEIEADAAGVKAVGLETYIKAMKKLVYLTSLHCNVSEKAVYMQLKPRFLALRGK